MTKRTVCIKCGRCCLHMKRYMTIEKAVSVSEFYCRCVLSKDRFHAKLTSENTSLCRDFSKKNLEACPFLKTDGEFTVCAIYNSRPEHCRTYMCSMPEE